MTIKIIDGLRYNTETATAVAEWDNGLHSGNFKNCEVVSRHCLSLKLGTRQPDSR